MKKYIYSDINSKLDPDKTGDFKVEYDGEAVMQSIKNIFATISGERVRNGIGSSLVRYLFQPMTEDTVDAIQSEITTNIKKHEPRIKTINVSVIGDKQKYIYEVTVTITISRFAQPLRFQTNLRSME